MPQSYQQLAAFIKAKISKDPRFGTEEGWIVQGNSFNIPQVVIQDIHDRIIRDPAKMKIIAQNDKLHDDMVLLRNSIEAFGLASPTAKVDAQGVFSLIYQPSIYIGNENARLRFMDYFNYEESDIAEVDFTLVAQFGDCVMPLEYNPDSRKWESIGIDELTPFTISFGKEEQPTRNGKIEIIKVTFCLNGEDRPSQHFYGKVGTIRDSNNSSVDLYSPTAVIEELLTDPLADDFLERIEPMIMQLPSGGLFVDQFINDDYKYGRYPVVGLREDPRTDGKRQWVNYVVQVMTEFGERNIRFPSKCQGLFTMLSNFYGVQKADNTVVQIDMAALFDEEVSEPDRFCVVYFHKQQLMRKDNGVEKPYWDPLLQVEPSTLTDFIPLSPTEVAAYKKDAGVGDKADKIATAEAQIAERMAAATGDDQNVDPGFRIDASQMSAAAPVPTTLPAQADATATLATPAKLDDADLTAASAYQNLAEQETAVTSSTKLSSKRKKPLQRRTAATAG